MNVTWAQFDDAWGHAMAMLPEGWRLRSIEKDGITVKYSGGGSEYVEWWRATARGPEDEELSETGSWPVMALYKLVVMVRERCGLVQDGVM